MHSIGSRITRGYYALALLLLGLSVVAYSDLAFVGQRVRQWETVSRLVEQLLEMRRAEKNFFLYHQHGDRLECLTLARGAMALLQRSPTLMGLQCPGPECTSLLERLELYQEAVASPPPPEEPRAVKWEEEIRNLGHQITAAAQALSARERVQMADSIDQSGKVLLLSILTIGLLGGLAGPLLMRRLVTALARLESALAPLAAGQFKYLQPTSPYREIHSFTNAFNRMLAELDTQRHHLVQSEKMASLGVLASGVAHELNNPLTNISTSCQLALEDAGNHHWDQMTHWLQQIDEQTERAQDIVLTLGDYARRRPLTLKPVSVEEILDKTLLLVRKQLGHQVTLVRDLAHCGEVVADHQRLQQVFINLLKNAVDAGGPGVTIRVLTQPVAALPPETTKRGYCLGRRPAPGDPSHPWVVITIADDGPGIPQELMKRIFEPFFTTHATGQGMGLGLYIVQEIIQELDGCILVSSQPGQGSSFHLILPGIPREGAS